MQSRSPVNRSRMLTRPSAGVVYSRRYSVLVNATAFPKSWPLAQESVEQADRSTTWRSCLEYYRLGTGEVVAVEWKCSEPDIWQHHSPATIERHAATFVATAKSDRIAAFTSTIPNQYILQRATEIQSPLPEAEARASGSFQVFAFAALGIYGVVSRFISRQKRLAIAQQQTTGELQAVMMDKIHADDMKLAANMMVVSAGVVGMISASDSLGKEIHGGLVAQGDSIKEAVEAQGYSIKEALEAQGKKGGGSWWRSLAENSAVVTVVTNIVGLVLAKVSKSSS